MPPESGEPGSPPDWLQRARSNLELARYNHENIYLEDLCFEAQQAAEKSLKAVLLHHEITFRYVHDLEELITTLAKQIEVPEKVNESVILTEYAVTARYPGIESIEKQNTNRRSTMRKMFMNGRGKSWSRRIDGLSSPDRYFTERRSTGPGKNHR